MTYDITDFVDLDSNTPCDILHMCKRDNNKKRDFLFVNDSQGKHVPVSPSKVLKLFGYLYDDVYLRLKDEKNILIVGFAETATAIAEGLYRFSIDNEFSKNLDVVYYLQTTRESELCQNQIETLFSFDEEHSHAVNQNLSIWKDKKENLTFDTVLFIDDEITTGKTILNFIDSFEKLKSGCKYYVVSIANWQNQEDRAKFDEKNIGVISLYNGIVKPDTPVMEVEKKEVFDYSKLGLNKVLFKDLEYHNPRFGLTKDEMLNNKKVEANIGLYLCALCDKDDIVEVVGTEEFMQAPLKIAYIIENYLDSKVRYHATTRSPITVSNDTVLYNGIKLPSAYDKDRITYLYNIKKCDKVFIITEKGSSLEFNTAITICYMDLGVPRENIFIVEI